MRETLGLMAIYLGLVTVLQVANVFIAHMISMAAPQASLLVFLGLFICGFGLSWPIAVRISHRLMPETDEERAAVKANSLAHIVNNLRPRPF